MKISKDERFTLRLSNQLLEEIRQVAREEDMTVTALLIYVVKKFLRERKEKCGEVTKEVQLEKRIDTLEELLLQKVG